MKMITTEYKIISDKLPPAFDGFTIAHVSDLHNREFGNELIERVAAVKPDIIVITGDMIHIENQSAAAEKFAMGAVQVAPVYYVSGNHERVLDCYAQFADFFFVFLVRVLDNRYEVCARGDDKIAVLGLCDPTFFEKGKTDFVAELNRQCAAIEEEGIRYTILLSHRPEMFERYLAAGVDLSLCGHTHGGHVRLPFFGAFYAPNQGLFPKYSDGKFTRDGKSMVISRGLGKSSWVPRIFNPSELAVERLLVKEKENMQTAQTQNESTETDIKQTNAAEE